MEWFQIFQSPWAFRALMASSMVGIMCGALGPFIVLRNMSLIGDALAHAILPGIVIAFMIAGHHSLGFFVGAVFAGLLTAVAITWIQQKVKTKNDAAIGIVFTAMFALGVMGISKISKSDGVHLDLKDFLFGNVLGVSDADLQLTATITIVVLLSIALFYRYLLITTFQPVVAAVMGIGVQRIHYFLMLLLSFAVVASLRTVGVILVVAMLITPASTALLLSSRLKTVVGLSAVIGLLSAITGLILSIKFETTPGPAMAVTVTIIYLMTVFFSPTRGLLSRAIHNRKLARKVAIEDLLKQTFHLENRGKNTLQNIAAKLGWSLSKIQSYAGTLSKKEWAKRDHDTLRLTPSGRDEALRLIRAHRLWESFLVNDVGLEEGQIHDDAERYEHILTDAQVDEIDRHLGYPERDPHGAPIPAEKKRDVFHLNDFEAGAQMMISPRQRNTYTTHQLWRMGLTPGEMITLVEKENDHFLIVSSEGEKFDIEHALGRQIQVEK